MSDHPTKQTTDDGWECCRVDACQNTRECLYPGDCRSTASWPAWRCGICGKQPCDGHGHHPVPVGEV